MDEVTTDGVEEIYTEGGINDNFEENIAVNNDDTNNFENVNLHCPCVRIEFDSHDDAYEFYNRYAGQVGFSVRKSSTCKSKPSNELIGRIFCCSLEGVRDLRSKPFEERSRNKADSKTGCKAMIAIRRRKSDTWIVSQFVKVHNHSTANKGPVRKNNDNPNKPTTRQQKPDKRARVQATDKHASNEIDYETQMYQARSVMDHSLHPYNVNPTYGFQPPFLNEGYFMPTDQQSLH
ncbi:hypothetical protein IFM89_019186, partial [Coptis chinensis]